MYTFFSNALLLAPNALGGVFLLLLVFAICFLGVHIAKYAVLGWQAHNKPQNAPPPQKEEKTAPTNPPEPVYYIVERKRKREKSKYYEPKEIRFK